MHSHSIYIARLNSMVYAVEVYHADYWLVII